MEIRWFCVDIHKLAQIQCEVRQVASHWSQDAGLSFNQT
jgi:hypothetical protein